eukprot:9385174-Alexandrium_andersonii.AAC.1
MLEDRSESGSSRAGRTMCAWHELVMRRALQMLSKLADGLDPRRSPGPPAPREAVCADSARYRKCLVWPRRNKRALAAHRVGKSR